MRPQGGAGERFVGRTETARGPSVGETVPPLWRRASFRRPPARPAAWVHSALKPLHW